MYDFSGDARNHHGSQCKHWTAFKRQAQAWLGNSWTLLETLGHSWKLLGTSGYFWKPLLLEIGELYYLGLWAKFTES